MKNQYRGGNCLKKSAGGWTVYRFKEGLGKKGGGLRGGWYPNAHYTIEFVAQMPLF